MPNNQEILFRFELRNPLMGLFGNNIVTDWLLKYSRVVEFVLCVFNILASPMKL